MLGKTKLAQDFFWFVVGTRTAAEIPEYAWKVSSIQAYLAVQAGLQGSFEAFLQAPPVDNIQSFVWGQAAGEASNEAYIEGQ